MSSLATWRLPLLLIAALLALQCSILMQFGQPLISAQGYVKLWEGVVLSAGNSQHIADWYTLSHIIHGFLFYALAWVLFPRASVGMRLVMALCLEAGWEVLENTPWLINLYRQQALAQGYSGDSIINSLADSVSMMLGFVLAWRLPVRVTVGVGVFLELFAAYSIRDNLTLNVLGFIHHFDFINNWQSKL